MPLEDDLLETAERLALHRDQPGRPRQADLRRAISTAYYAVFHALCSMCANALVGARQNPDTPREAWKQVYRAVEHSYCARQCRKDLIQKKFPVQIRDFCGAFTELQEKRHQADYDPHAQFAIKDVEETIKIARQAIAAIRDRNLNSSDKRAFVVWILMRSR